MRRVAGLLLVAAALAGCGDRASIEAGGRAPGDILTVYTLLPREGPRAQAAQDINRGAKLALAQAGGRAGEVTVQFATAALPASLEADPIADVVEAVVRDTGTVAVIGDLDARTARYTAPLLNAVGILHVSPGTAPSGLAQPAAEPSFVPLVPADAAQAAALGTFKRGTVGVESEPGGLGVANALGSTTKRSVDAETVVYSGSDPVNARGVVRGVLAESPRAQVLLTQELATTDIAGDLGPRVRALTSVRAGAPPGFADAYPGLTPGPFARAGFDAMNDVLAALRRAGPRASTRLEVIRAFEPSPPGPFRLID
ncbi:MAG: hypothetical protein WKF94_15700 [Solirubrobacteraceae bacterium]